MGIDRVRKFKREKLKNKASPVYRKTADTYICSYNIRLPCFCTTLLNPPPLAAHCIAWSHRSSSPPAYINNHCSAVVPGAQRLSCTQTMSLLITGTCLKCDLCFFSLTVANTHSSLLGHWVTLYVCNGELQLTTWHGLERREYQRGASGTRLNQASMSSCLLEIVLILNLSWHKRPSPPCSQPLPQQRILKCVSVDSEQKTISHVCLPLSALQCACGMLFQVLTVTSQQRATTWRDPFSLKLFWQELYCSNKTQN